jgi:hypothetical protein
MTDGPSRDIEDTGQPSVTGPAGEGRLERAPGRTGDYRDELRSRRWNAAPLENPEVEKTDPRIAVTAIVILSVITFVVLVVGYGLIDLWSVA